MRPISWLHGGLLVASLCLSACGGGGGGGGGGTTPAPNPPAPPPQKTLFVATQPAGAVQAAAFTTQPVVHVRSNGATDVADSTTVVTASVVPGTGAAGAQLTGATSVTAVAGIATFTNLGINAAGNGYQLRFTATGVTEATSAAFDASSPPAVQLSFTVDSSQDVRPISRFIYGMNGWDPAERPANLTLSRSGGNRMTAYNWETNASNAGADWFNQNDDFLGGGDAPNGAVGPGIEAARAAGAGIVVTVPIIGYVAADKNGDGDVALSGPNYLETRFHQSRARKPGGNFSLVPDVTDDFVNQDEYVNFLGQTYPGAFGSATTPLMLSLDNEPDLWQHTHARLRGDGDPATQAGDNATYVEIVQRTVDYADAIKDVAPSALVFGPVNYGWQGMVRFQDAPDHGNRDFLEFYLAQMAAAEGTHGHRLVDVLDVHWYPEAQGNNAMGAGTRITGDDTDPGVVAAREQAPRSLWDGTYTETSWITGCCSGGPIRLLPRLKEKIVAHYPGTRLAITEYNYGAGGHISGAIAQADVLGIFGREGVFAANLWKLSDSNDFIHGAFEMYRNFDGANGAFGDTHIRATTSDAASASIYASVDAGNANRMVLVVINKADVSQLAGITISHAVSFTRARVYRLTSASSVPQRVMPDVVITGGNAFQHALPANSVTTLVLE